ncbi:AMP-binding protein [Rhodococcus koreensis]
MSLRDSGRHLHGLLEAAAADNPDMPVVTFIGDRTYTTSGLLNSVRRVAGGLQDAGVQVGDRIAMMVGNRVEFLISYLAVSSIGAVSIPLNTALQGDVLEHMLSSVAPCRLILEDDYAPQLIPAAERSGSVTEMWCITDDAELPATRGMVPFRSLAESEPLTTSYPAQPWELTSILFTSGTTGPSKGVMWSHETALNVAEASSWVMGYTEEDIVFTCLPLFHINALFTAFFAALQKRATVVVAERFSASEFWRQIRDYRATVTNMLGAIGSILWRQKPIPEEKEHNLRLAMLVPFPVGYEEEFEQRFGMKITELYGSTDTGLPLGVPHGQSRPGSCGIPTPGWEVMLANADDEPVAVGEAGELLTRPSQPFVGQLGYWNLPEKTWESHRNCWFHTGDVLRQDSEGWFYYVDRMKDAIRVSGENVSSFEVEQVLISHSLVLEAAVYAVPSELGEDSVMAAIVVSDPDEFTVEDLVRFATPRLPYFAVPRYIEVLEVLPKTSTQKIRKATLRDRGITSTTSDIGPRRRGCAAHP